MTRIGSEVKGLVDAVADAEKIADRALDAGVLFAVPKRRDRHQPGVVGRLMGDGAPDVGDRAGAFQLGEGERAAGGDGAGIGIAVLQIGVGRRGPATIEVVQLFQARERIARRKLGGGG